MPTFPTESPTPWPRTKIARQAIIFPTAQTATRIISESGLTFGKSFLWPAILGVVASVLYLALSLAPGMVECGCRSELSLITDTILAVDEAILWSAVIYLIYTATIHLAMKVGRKSGGWKHLITLVNVMAVPYIFIGVVSWIINAYVRLDLWYFILGIVIWVVGYVLPLIIHVNYGVKWLRAVLVSCYIVVLFFLIPVFVYQFFVNSNLAY